MLNERFLSTIADSDEIVEPMNLSLEETKALSRFWALEVDRMSMEMVQMYLLGCRSMWELMELLGLNKAERYDFAKKVQNKNKDIDC